MLFHNADMGSKAIKKKKEVVITRWYSVASGERWLVVTRRIPGGLLGAINVLFLDLSIG